MSEKLDPQRLAMTDMPDLAGLLRDVAAGALQGYIRPKAEADLIAIVEGRAGAAFGVRENGKLIAAGLLTFPGTPPPGAPPFPRVPPAEWEMGAAFFDSAVVCPDKRGRGLQRRLFDARLAHARAEGLRWFCAGVHASNVVSWSNPLAKRMAIVGIAYFHGYPLFALLRSDDARALEAAAPAVLISATDINGHERALREGMIGDGLTNGFVSYRRAL